MSYLDELLAGYRQALAGKPQQPIEGLRAALATADDPRQRGALLGLLALAMAASGHAYSSTNKTPIGLRDSALSR